MLAKHVVGTKKIWLRFDMYVGYNKKEKQNFSHNITMTIFKHCYPGRKLFKNWNQSKFWLNFKTDAAGWFQTDTSNKS